MTTNAQKSDKPFVIFTKDGKKTDIDHIVKEAILADVVFIGESHNDSIAKELEKKLLKMIHQKVINPANTANKKNVVLCLEMFETDVQLIMDEFIKGLITEDHFIFSARAWPDYKKTYHPLIVYAKENKIRVVAANAPRRYVNMVSRLGRHSLDDLSDTAKSWLPPLPYREASDSYKKKLEEFSTFAGKNTTKPSKNHGKKTTLSPEKAKRLMEAMKHASHKVNQDAQSLWDASMAWSISKALRYSSKTIAISVNGNFHSEGGLGIPEHLSAYSPALKIMTISVKQKKNLPAQLPSKTEHDDFVIITAPPN